MPGTVECSFIGRPAWDQQPASDGLHKYTVYIWHGVTAGLLHLYDACFTLLEPQEQARALRYYQLKDKQRYVIQHGILRVLLGQQVNMPARQIPFTYNSNKKPGLAVADRSCHFNISHSAGEFLIALGDTELGIDIEWMNPDFAYADVASQYFSAAEVDYINSSPDATAAFFLLWTRKEALLKACGTGIDDNLPDMPALDGKGTLPVDYENIGWITESFFTGENFMGSITYPSPKTCLQFRKLDIETLCLLF
ncbi:4'-phosphopantetheinyl transferase superfamily protein [Mucilaginibacter mali]|uniref:4'-phosphopantetheinyl transferase superfamily protein n=1 Tax=Mucilaginibacter mali TaxID=2740462 RepID=A0A7D4PYL7_9SPHI|nr:4'-phosphopantetheinyl transferase superfamily protein [Mucilaginibacter mali]QKJ28306.1 4'-phosphopantetheinyl transferase superfamily protein [Mucilaginibacter mali]